MSLEDGDRLLLCTDGLPEMVTDDLIAQTLSRSDQPRFACQALVDLALEGGGNDNVTVVVAHYHVRPEPEP
jgi:protein phosphatase